jgi:hypothetical protein
MDELKNNPGRKMRVLLAGGKTSPITRLPKKAGSVSVLPSLREGTTTQPDDTPGDEMPSPPAKGVNFRFGPPFWTIASVLSMMVNIVLITLLIVLLPNIKKIDVNTMTGLGSKLLGDLYVNFEKMDRAHITTTIPVETTIPVKFDLQLNQQTNVILSQDVTINNARVTVKTGGLNITNALTTIILPQGTNLPVVLNLTVPVDTTVPVRLNVNVDIPMAQTQLHEPFFGLQEAVKPFYCMLNAGALNLDSQPICN